jgi:hypothetical protein
MHLEFHSRYGSSQDRAVKAIARKLAQDRLGLHLLQEKARFGISPGEGPEKERQEIARDCGNHGKPEIPADAFALGLPRDVQQLFLLTQDNLGLLQEPLPFGRREDRLFRAVKENDPDLVLKLLQLLR